MKEFTINFKCPKCGGTHLDAKQRALVYTPIVDYTFYDDEFPIEILGKTDVGGIYLVDVEETVGYECRDCPDFKIQSDIELIKFLKESGMLEEAVSDT
jgi:hypothetical protein